MHSSLVGYTSLQQILQMIEYFDLSPDVRVYGALAADAERLYPVCICEALGDNQIGMLLAPADPMNVLHTLTISDLVNSCPDDCEDDECHFLTTLDGTTLMVAGSLHFRDGKHSEIVMVFVPCGDEPAPYAARTLH